MTKDEYDYVMANVEYKRHCEIIEEYVKSKLGIYEEDGYLSFWEACYSEKPKLDLYEEFFKRHPDGNWDMFEAGCNAFFTTVNETLYEILDDLDYDNETVRCWIKRGTDYVYRAMNPYRRWFGTDETPED